MNGSSPRGSLHSSSAGVGYLSTRAAAGDVPVSFAAALLAGLAPDGGLYLPERLMPVASDDQRAASPAALARKVLAPLMGEELARTLEPALDFPWPLVRISGDRYLLELFHGPTAAFKDVGARSLARLMAAVLAGRGERTTILVATSGDTGSAVADAFAGLENVRVALLFPAEGVSEVQEQQLTAERDGVRAFAVSGSFDDCQRLVKSAFGDDALADLRLSSANSINIGRLLPQTLYYFWALQQLREDHAVSVPPLVVVPSGNLGNLTAGLLARELGLDLGGFVAAHNRNDYFPRFLAGASSAYQFAPSVATLSNAMDVGAPSNFERLQVLFGTRLSGLVGAEAIDDDATLARMRLTYQQDGYLVDPHTAVGLEALARKRSRESGREHPTIVLSTAHPAKFPAAVRRATGTVPEPPPQLAVFAAAPKRVEPLAADLAALRAALLDWPA